MPAFLFLTLFLATTSASQDRSTPSGFEPLAADAYTAGLFEDLTVRPGPSARVMAKTLHGTQGGQPFVNVVRWSDARRFRQKVISIRLPVRLDAPTLDTSARLWVRTRRADGSIAFEDFGFDTRTSSSQWTKLASTGAVAKDATDLCFGLIVEGPTPVHLEGFEVEVLGDAGPLDARHAVPERWIKDPNLSMFDVLDPWRGLDVRVTTFRPPGHGLSTLPHLWLVMENDSIRRSYAAGRDLIEGMRLGLDPPVILSVIQPRAGVLPALARTAAGCEIIQSRLGGLSPQGDDQPRPIPVAYEPGSKVPALLLGPGGELSLPESVQEELRESVGVDGCFGGVRILVRWASARHEAAGDPALADLLFDASLMALKARRSRPAVSQKDHSLVGHECGHDHSHDHDH